MNGWQFVRTFTDDGKSSQIRMEGDPCSAEELIEDVVLLAVTIQEASTQNVHFDPRVLLWQSHSRLFKLFHWQELGQRHSVLKVLVLVRLSLDRSVGPGHWRTDDDERLILGFFRSSQCFQNEFCLLDIAVELRHIKHDEVSVLNLLLECLRLLCEVKDLDRVRWALVDQSGRRDLIQRTKEAMWDCTTRVIDEDVVITNLLKQTLAEQVVDVRDKNTLGVLQTAEADVGGNLIGSLGLYGGDRALQQSFRLIGSWVFLCN